MFDFDGGVRSTCTYYLLIHKIAIKSNWLGQVKDAIASQRQQPSNSETKFSDHPTKRFKGRREATFVASSRIGWAGLPFRRELL